MKRLFSNKQILFQIVLLFFISGVTYLPRVGQLQYYKDDWYYVLDGTYGGPTVFNEMFAIDRPARGPFFQAYFSLFGANPLPYHLGHYFWRVAAALAALWLLRMVWPGRTRLAFLGALFFLIYPGYLWWTSGIEYQPMVVSLCLQVLSIALTIKAFLSEKFLHKVILIAGSVLTGWAYLALVDYAIGTEFFRLALLFVLVNRIDGAPYLRKIARTFRTWLSSSFVIPAGFLFWKIFIFTSERKVTDLGTQLVPFLDAPRQVLKLWLVGLVRDGLTVSTMAWIEPFSQSFWTLNPNQIILGLIFAVLFITFIFNALRYLNKSQVDNEKYEPVLVGIVSCFAGVIPIEIANRFIDFGSYSHYSLPVSLAGALFLAGLVSFISNETMKNAFISLVLTAAFLTHYTVALSVVREIETVNSFWWQTYWRVPGMRAGTTLIVDYPELGFDDTADNVWGPANLLYFPVDRQQQVPVYYQLAALPLRGPEIENVFSKGAYRSAYRTHYFRYNRDQIVVLTQPVDGACVRVVDGSMPVLSSNDTAEIRMVAPYSKLDSLDLQSLESPPSRIFGREPEHAWCYFFEKLDLAVQQRNWDMAVSLGDQALAAKLSPKDPVEWMPFLLTYMVDGDFEKVETIARKIKKDEALEKKVCTVFLKSLPANPQISKQMIETVDFLFCHK